MSSTDSVSSELRKAEKEIDNCYKSNLLIKFPFATAAWYLLSSAEEYMLNEQMGGVNSVQDIHNLGSDFITEIEHSMSWIYHACEQSGQIPIGIDSSLYQASKDLFELGQKYDLVVFAYTCASAGLFGLELNGSTIQPTGDFFTKIEYEAYNILIDPREPEEVSSLLNLDNFPIIEIKNYLKIEDDRFHYKLNSRMISDTKTFLKPLFDRIFLLPSEWEFSRYTLEDFRKVFEIICATSHIHSTAHRLAALQGCYKSGYLDSIYLITYGRLIRSVVKHSNISPLKVQSILEDLTYGNSGITSPIPALQPLIKLNLKHYAIVPNIWICSATERNLTVLLNKFPSEKEIYAKLSNKKENLLRQRIITDLSNNDFELVWGKVPNLVDVDLGDVDLAIINNCEKVCLLLELKCFIAPTTAHERINRSKDIKKGVSQIQKLKQHFTDNYEPLLKKLNIDSSYRVEGVVVSENWIGYGNVQSLDVPVIRSNHLIEKLKTTDSLRSTMDWLKDRKYLPKEGVHYTVHRPDITIGNWNFKWFGIQDHCRSVFFPL